MKQIIYGLVLSLFVTSVFASKEEALKLWGQRDQKASLQKSLNLFEELHKKDPTNLEYLTYLSQGYYLMGGGHTDEKDEKKALFEKGRTFGETALNLNEEFRGRAKRDGVENALGSLSEKEATVLFWAATNLGSWSRANGVMSSLGYKNQIQAMIRRVEALKPDVAFGGVHRYWGAFYSLAPGIAGGDMKKSKEHFEKALKLYPNFLGTKVLFAETYWVKEEGRKEFEKLLNEVIAAKADDPNYGAENRIEKNKAEKLLKKADELF